MVLTAHLEPRTPTLVVACEIFEDELRHVLANLEARNPEQSPAASPPQAPQVVWVESGLHDVPDNLRGRLQGLIDQIDEAVDSRLPTVTLGGIHPGRGEAARRRELVAVQTPNDILLAYGFCGYSLAGLSSRSCRLVFPRVDDCVHLFLNHGSSREEVVRDAHAFYLTKGWLTHDNFMLDSYESWDAQYGPERARRLREAYLKGYERLTLIDTRAYETPVWQERMRGMAQHLELDYETVPGSTKLLERLLTGPWDREIVVIDPGRPIHVRDLLFHSGQAPTAG